MQNQVFIETTDIQHLTSNILYILLFYGYNNIYYTKLIIQGNLS